MKDLAATLPIVDFKLTPYTLLKLVLELEGFENVSLNQDFWYKGGFKYVINYVSNAPRRKYSECLNDSDFNAILPSLSHELLEGLLTESVECKRTLELWIQLVKTTSTVHLASTKLLLMLVTQILHEAQVATNNSDYATADMHFDIIHSFINFYFRPAYTLGCVYTKKMITTSIFKCIKVDTRFAEDVAVSIIKESLCSNRTETVVETLIEVEKLFIHISNLEHILKIEKLKLLSVILEDLFESAINYGKNDQIIAVRIIHRVMPLYTSKDLLPTFLEGFAVSLKCQSVPAVSVQLNILISIIPGGIAGLLKLLYSSDTETKTETKTKMRAINADDCVRFKKLGKASRMIDSQKVFNEVCNYIYDPEGTKNALHYGLFLVLAELADAVPRKVRQEFMFTILFTTELHECILHIPSLLPSMKYQYEQEDFAIIYECCMHAFHDTNTAQELSNKLYTYPYKTSETIQSLLEPFLNEQPATYFQVPAPLCGWLGTLDQASSRVCFCARQIYLTELSKNPNPEPSYRSLFGKLRLSFTDIMDTDEVWTVLETLAKTHYLMQQSGHIKNFLVVNIDALIKSLQWIHEKGVWRCDPQNQLKFRKCVTSVKGLLLKKVVKSSIPYTDILL